jgi:hypothetical protein
VLVLRELALYLGADSESRRIRGQAIREILLDLLQLAKELVVFGVRNAGTVEDVVFVGRAREKRAQLAGAAMLLRVRRGPWRALGAVIPGCFLVRFRLLCPACRHR